MVTHLHFHNTYNCACFSPLHSSESHSQAPNTLQSDTRECRRASCLLCFFGNIFLREINTRRQVHYRYRFRSKAKYTPLCYSYTPPVSAVELTGCLGQPGKHRADGSKGIGAGNSDHFSSKGHVELTGFGRSEGDNGWVSSSRFEHALVECSYR